MTERTTWWRLGPAIVVVAIVVAGFAIAFRASLGAVVDLLGGSTIVDMIVRAPPWERLALPAAGGLAAGLVVMMLARRQGGAGVGYVMEAIVLGRVRIPLVRSLLQFLASWLAIAGGNSIGREGPLIQAGAAAGEAARKGFRLDDNSARLVLAAGVAAGFASAYNAPIAAALFVVEIVTGVLVLDTAVPVLIASVLATVVTRIVIGGATLYTVPQLVPHPLELIAFAGLALVCAPLGVGFLRVLALADRGWRRLPMPWRTFAGGLACGAILCAIPEVAGNGLEPLSDLLNTRVALAGVVLLLVAKVAATSASVGSGNPGGVFTPTLLLGGCAGTLYALGLHAAFGDAIASPAAYTLVGLACAMAATTHAPMTAAILACELSGNYTLVLPLLLACALSAALARRLYIDSVYTAELTRRGLRWRLTLDGRRVIENQQAVVDVV